MVYGGGSGLVKSFRVPGLQHGIHVVLCDDVIAQVNQNKGYIFWFYDVIVKIWTAFIAPEPILLIEQPGEIAIPQKFQFHPAALQKAMVFMPRCKAASSQSGHGAPGRQIKATSLQNTNL